MKNTIRVERAKKRISQQELGENVNISKTQINRIENGKSDPKISTAMKIANYFGVETEQLFTD